MTIATVGGLKSEKRSSKGKSPRFYKAVSEATKEDREKYPAFMKAASTLVVLSWVFRILALLTVITFISPQVIEKSFSFLYTVFGISLAVTFTLFFALCKTLSEASVVMIDMERHQRVTQEGILHLIKIHEQHALDDDLVILQEEVE